MSNLRVREINPESKNLPHALGITGERQEELTKVVESAIKQSSSVSESLDIASTQAEHPNELVMVGWLAASMKYEAKLAMLEELSALFLGGMDEERGEDEE